jgi:DNA topoisomerase-1
MPINLLVVESPSKAKTLKKYLGRNFEVLASYGHVRDLEAKEGAVDPEQGFRMKYALVERNKKHVDAIARAAEQAEQILLATDPDREGEAIAWHLSEILRGKKGLRNRPLKRVVFYEITESAVRKACSSRATSPCRWSTRSRRGAHSIIWWASISRRCCGARSAPACRPAECRARRCA